MRALRALWVVSHCRLSKGAPHCHGGSNESLRKSTRVRRPTLPGRGQCLQLVCSTQPLAPWPPSGCAPGVWRLSGAVPSASGALLASCAPSPQRLTDDTTCTHGWLTRRRYLTRTWPTRAEVCPRAPPFARRAAPWHTPFALGRAYDTLSDALTPCASCRGHSRRQAAAPGQVPGPPGRDWQLRVQRRQPRGGEVRRRGHKVGGRPQAGERRGGERGASQQGADSWNGSPWVFVPRGGRERPCSAAADAPCPLPRSSKPGDAGGLREVRARPQGAAHCPCRWLGCRGQVQGAPPLRPCSRGRARHAAGAAGQLDVR